MAIRTAHGFVLEFANLTQMTLVTLLNLARALRARGLFTKAPAGRGYDKIVPTPHELANFILAQAAEQASEAAETIGQLRPMKFRGVEPPVFGIGTFGDIFDRMVGGGSGQASKTSEVVSIPLPNEIRLSANPYRAVLIWRPNGEKPWANTYTPDMTERPFGSNMLFKETFIHPKVIELAWQTLAGETTSETRNATLAGAALQVDQPTTTHATERSDSHKSEPTRARVSFQSEKPTSQRS